jgi:hypothetical protein
LVILSGLPVDGKPLLAGGVETGAPGRSDRWAAAVVLVVGGHVADPFVQPVLWGSPGRSRVDLRVSAVQRLIAERY